MTTIGEGPNRLFVLRMGSVVVLTLLAFVLEPLTTAFLYDLEEVHLFKRAVALLVSLIVCACLAHGCLRALSALVDGRRASWVGPCLDVTRLSLLLLCIEVPEFLILEALLGDDPPTGLHFHGVLKLHLLQTIAVGASGAICWMASRQRKANDSSASVVVASLFVPALALAILVPGLLRGAWQIWVLSGGTPDFIGPDPLLGKWFLIAPLGPIIGQWIADLRDKESAG